MRSNLFNHPYEILVPRGKNRADIDLMSNSLNISMGMGVVSVIADIALSGGVGTMFTLAAAVITAAPTVTTPFFIAARRFAARGMHDDFKMQAYNGAPPRMPRFQPITKFLRKLTLPSFRQ